CEVAAHGEEVGEGDAHPDLRRAVDRRLAKELLATKNRLPDGQRAVARVGGEHRQRSSASEAAEPSEVQCSLRRLLARIVSTLQATAERAETKPGAFA